MPDSFFSVGKLFREQWIKPQKLQRLEPAQKFSAISGMPCSTNRSVAYLAPELVCSRLILICNGNWTEWSTIQGVIARVISKSDEREARGRFEITNTITP